ncbi:hypothetical protein KI387_022925, partial [Taxus chinensis]
MLKDEEGARRWRRSARRVHRGARGEGGTWRLYRVRCAGGAGRAELEATAFGGGGEGIGRSRLRSSAGEWRRDLVWGEGRQRRGWGRRGASVDGDIAWEEGGRGPGQVRRGGHGFAGGSGQRVEEGGGAASAAPTGGEGGKGPWGGHAPTAVQKGWRGGCRPPR